MTDTYETWKRAKTCGDKRPYHCQLDANQAVLAQMKQGLVRSTYVCPYCTLIHLTSAEEAT